MRLNRRIAALAVLAGVAMAPAHADVKVGDYFPDLAASSLEGTVPNTKGHVVLVDFWASWCLPCAKSFPVMEELQKIYGSRGLVVIAVNVDEKKSDMESFLRDHPVNFALVRDAKQKVVEKAGVSTMPSSFILDKNGKVVFAHSGFHGSSTKKEYEHEIESLLAK